MNYASYTLLWHITLLAFLHVSEKSIAKIRE